MVYHHRYVRRPSITDAEYRLTRFAQFTLAMRPLQKGAGLGLKKCDNSVRKSVHHIYLVWISIFPCFHTSDFRISTKVTQRPVSGWRDPSEEAQRSETDQGRWRAQAALQFDIFGIVRFFFVFFCFVVVVTQIKSVGWRAQAVSHLHYFWDC